MATIYENYRTVNKKDNAADKDWFLSLQFEVKRAYLSATLNNGKNAILESFWKASKEDVVFVGNKLTQSNGFEAAAATGQVGVVAETLSKAKAGKPAATVDYVFSCGNNKAPIALCEEQLDREGDAFDLLFYQFSKCAYPLVFTIRKILCAATVLAHADDCSPESVNKAAALLTGTQRISKKTIDISKDERGVPAPVAGYINLNLRSVQIDTEGENEKEIEGIAGCRNGLIIRGKSDGGVDCDEIQEYINKYSFIGAVSIMVRGNFVNLLEAFLSVRPPIETYRAELIRLLSRNVQNEAMELLLKC